MEWKKKTVFIASSGHCQHMRIATVPSYARMLELSCACGPLFSPESPITSMKGDGEVNTCHGNVPLLSPII